MKDVHVPFLSNLFEEYSTQTLTLEQLHDRIKAPDEQVTKTCSALRDMSKGSLEYDLKKHELPCVLINVATNGGNKKKDVLGFTGLLFLDIDNVPMEVTARIKERIMMLLPSTLMVWVSPGGRGLHLIALVAGIEGRCFKAIREMYCSFDFDGHRFDPKCFKSVQKMFLSMDQNILVNWQASTLDLSHLPSEKSTATKSYHAPPLSRIREERREIGMRLCGGLRLNNADDYFTGSYENVPHRYFPDKVHLVQVDPTYRKIGAGNRNSWLWINLVVIYFLNPQMDHSEVFSFGMTLNRRCDPPLDQSEVARIAHGVFMNRYTPKPNWERTVLHNPRLKKSIKQKQSESQSILRKAKGEQTSQLIYDFIEAYESDTKLTNRMISVGTGIPLRTVERHAKQFREMIEHNHPANAGARPLQAGTTVVPMDDNAGLHTIMKGLQEPHLNGTWTGGTSAENMKSDDEGHIRPLLDRLHLHHSSAFFRDEVDKDVDPQIDLLLPHGYTDMRVLAHTMTSQFEQQRDWIRYNAL